MYELENLVLGGFFFFVNPLGEKLHEKGRLLAHTLRRRRNCKAPTTLYIEADKGSQRLRGLFTQNDRCNQVEMAFAPTKVHVGPM